MKAKVIDLKENFVGRVRQQTRLTEIGAENDDARILVAYGRRR